MTNFPVWGPCQLIWFPWFGCRQSLISWKGMAKYTLSIQVKVLKNHFVISQPKNDFLDAQKSRLNETVLLSTQNKGSNGWKIASVLTILSIKVHLSGPMFYQTPLWKIIQLKIMHFIILCTINLAIVLYGWAHPHQISSFICCHVDTSADHLKRFSIKKDTELPNTAAVLKWRLILRLAGNVGISDHWGKPKPFSNDCLVTENEKSIANAAIFWTFSEK